MHTAASCSYISCSAYFEVFIVFSLTMDLFIHINASADGQPWEQLKSHQAVCNTPAPIHRLSPKLSLRLFQGISDRLTWEDTQPRRVLWLAMSVLHGQLAWSSDTSRHFSCVVVLYLPAWVWWPDKKQTFIMQSIKETVVVVNPLKLKPHQNS